MSDVNKVIHKVELEWHYPILTKYGFQPTTTSAVGLVRSYVYVNDELHKSIQVNTGVHSDYWTDITDDSGKLWGYHGSLEGYVKSLTHVNLK